jgi:hypothetical protein
MKARPNLTGLDVARHRYPDPPLLDGACRGLRLVASPPIGARRDRGSWVYRYRTREGRLRQIKLGEYPEMSLAEAPARHGATRRGSATIWREETLANVLLQSTKAYFRQPPYQAISETVAALFPSADPSDIARYLRRRPRDK